MNLSQPSLGKETNHWSHFTDQNWLHNAPPAPPPPICKGTDSSNPVLELNSGEVGILVNNINVKNTDPTSYLLDIMKILQEVDSITLALLSSLKKVMLSKINCTCYELTIVIIEWAFHFLPLCFNCILNQSQVHSLSINSDLTYPAYFLFANFLNWHKGHTSLKNIFYLRSAPMLSVLIESDNRILSRKPSH